ncbi:hypothetical protein AUEXF2481DRAFT_36763 [Aureobasidium subglaciale EXF-2481]|uniref:Uncharacterized protein n=1 Tax=Aureobasidium subglaciale (strain EXF-2481) TaxID=1043005 RepID=A0A074YKP3_AURSE|nr:uncharacterized protein AUEXF2481DRAFT_36763 [Aureobasidium subglaciale EXF-2481]KEQ98255.1 hypothetical protein AUEXF2481DRAFT_36763 [Aureobasidium subglaciale EXF-2481]
MQIKPICEFMNYNESEVSSIEARSSARHVGISTSVYKLDLFSRCRVGRPYNKPMSFLQHGLFAAVLRPGEASDDRLKAARMIKEQQTAHYEAAVEIWSSHLDMHVPMSDDGYMRILALSCDLKREFEYEIHIWTSSPPKIPPTNLLMKPQRSCKSSHNSTLSNSASGIGICVSWEEEARSNVW